MMIFMLRLCVLIGLSIPSMYVITASLLYVVYRLTGGRRGYLWYLRHI